MATYLIDYENVKSEGIKGIAQLGENDRVVIFYSHNADTITFEAMDMIFNSKAQVSKYKILCGGKNALDFQLSTYLGYLIHEAKDSYFYIISKDNGFKHVVDFWKRTFRFDGYVYCFATIADGNARQNRFKNASAKERARAMEEELVAMSEELEAEDSENEETPEERAVVEVVEENASNEPAETESEETTPIETVTEEPAVEEIPTEASNEELVNEEPVTKEALTESIKAEPDLSESLAEADQESDNTQPVTDHESDKKEPEVKTSSEVEKLDEESVLPIDEDELLPETVIYPVQQHKPVSVMPPAQLPDSIREELKKADAEYKESSEADLKEKIAAAVSVSTIKVVESGMTIHHVEESTKKEASVSEKSTEKPVKKSAKKSEKKSEKKSVEKVVTEKTEKPAKPARKPRTPKKPKEVKEEAKEQLAQKEEPAEKAEKPAKPARKPITRSTRAKKKETAEEVAETPVQEKPVRRGRRPKTQGNIAASFE